MTESKKPSESTHELLILRDDRIIETTARLQRRISERFPESGLCDLCGHLLSIARQAAERSQQIDEKIVWIRVLGYTLATAMVLIMLTLLVALVLPSHKNADIPTDGMHIAEFLQTMEAGTNEAILLGAGIYFLISFETRIKRGRALAAVHELRAMCHIIDMHQLTKDPERVLAIWKGTSNSPRQQMTPLELNRYLDYCSEMLSLTGKIAALYVKRFDDAASVAAVSEVEQLSTAMSRKIWQKIMILNQSIPNVLPRCPTSASRRRCLSVRLKILSALFHTNRKIVHNRFPTGSALLSTTQCNPAPSGRGDQPRKSRLRPRVARPCLAS